MNAATTQPAPLAREAAPYRWTVDSFYRAIDAGVFDHPERIELIDGSLVERGAQTPPHASLVCRLASQAREAFEPQFLVREQKPLHIADDTEPVPDILVVAEAEGAYWERHPAPADTALLIEVADTSASYNAGGKALLYAQAGIAEYWVVLLPTQEILVHREPAAGGYGSIARVGAGDEIAPLSAPAIKFTVGQLLNR